MPFINVILKDGTKVTVPDATKAQWVSEPVAVGATAVAIRLVCTDGDKILGKFNSDSIAGYTWHDGMPR